MFKKLFPLFIIALIVNLFSFSVYAQTTVQNTGFKRNNDAATITGQPNGAPTFASLTRYGELFVTEQPGLNACSAAATGTTAVNIIAAVSAKSHLVYRVNCYNNSTVASVITLNSNVTAVDADIIGTTTLGNNRVRFDFPRPIKVAINAPLTFTPTTTATSTVCCANYTDVPNP